MRTREEAIKYAEDLNGLTSREEKEALWDLSWNHIQDGGLAIEVGTWCGASAVIIGEVCRQKNARLICIDGFSTNMHAAGDGVQIDCFNSVLTNCKDLPIDYMAGNSVNFVKYLKPEIADFIFVDGDHNYPDVETDIEGYWQAVKKGGCYLMHDYGNPCDVKEVVDRFFKGLTINHVDSAVYIIK